MITALIGSAALSVYVFMVAPTPMVAIIGFVLSGVVNGIFYGCFALLFSKSEMY